jgi:hypothetical protein
MSIYLHKCQIHCIQLNNRFDRKKMDFQIKYEIQDKNQTPSKGNMISHLKIIKTYWESNKNNSHAQYLMILEDNAKFISNTTQLDNIPPKWDMLYLGGRVGQKYGSINQPWVAMSSYDNHAYLINFNKPSFIENLIKMAEIYLIAWESNTKSDTEPSYSSFMKDYIHGRYNCYMINPEIAIKLSRSYGDVKKYITSSPTMALSVHGYSNPEHYFEGNNYVLKLSDVSHIELPTISLITLVEGKRKRDLITLAIHNYTNLLYPQDKIEWVILEFVESGGNNITDLLPKIPQIKYYSICDSKEETNDNTQPDITLGEKLNFLNSHSSGKYIVHFNLGWNYVIQSVDSRIKCLLKYNYVNCLGCSRYGLFDLDTSSSIINSESNYQLLLPTLAYKKSFWKNRKFIQHNFETTLLESFFTNRLESLMDLPYESVAYCLQSKNNNINNNLNSSLNSTSIQNNSPVSFIDILDEDTQLIVQMLAKQTYNPFKLQYNPEDLVDIDDD